jgi:hypothetical protein
VAGGRVYCNQAARSALDYAQPDKQWSGLAVELLDQVPKPDPLPRSWPKDPTRFGVWARRLGRPLESAGIEVVKEARTKAGQPYSIRRIPSPEPARNMGKIATPATQLHPEPVTSENARSFGVAAKSPATPATSQLHQPQASDQQECSYVAGVADFPTMRATAEEDDSWVRESPDDLDQDDYAGWPADSIGAEVNHRSPGDVAFCRSRLRCLNCTTPRNKRRPRSCRSYLPSHDPDPAARP